MGAIVTQDENMSKHDKDGSTVAAVIRAVKNCSRGRFTLSPRERANRFFHSPYSAATEPVAAQIVRMKVFCHHSLARRFGGRKELFMRVVRVVAAVGVLLVARPLLAQEWDRYENLDDRFAVSAPGRPTIEKMKWKSEYDSMFPATVYRWQQGPNRYTTTVVDYADSEAIYTANHHSEDFLLPMYWQIDILGSIQYAATQYRQKPGVKVTFDAFHYINMVTGHELQLTSPDQSRTYVGIYLHENRLYIFDATVAKGMPPPLIFQQSPEFLDASGTSIRYRTYYFNRLPEPRLAGRGGRGAGGPPGAGPQGAPPGGGGPIQRGAPPQQ